jgi:hypothetical protein
VLRLGTGAGGGNGRGLSASGGGDAVCTESRFSASAFPTRELRSVARLERKDLTFCSKVLLNFVNSE